MNTPLSSLKNNENQGKTAAIRADRSVSSYVGPVSLAVAGSGLALTHFFVSGGMLNGHLATILLGGFNGATVGGLADWYAVSALFRKLGPHSDILRRRRPQIEEKIIDLVMNHWLSRDSLRDHVHQLQPSKFFIDWMSQAGHPAQAAQLVRQGLNRIVPELDRPEVAAALDRILRDRLEHMELAPQLGRWLQHAIARADHEDMWNTVLDAIDREAQSPETQRAIARLIRQSVTDYLPTILRQLDRPELETYLRQQLKLQLQQFDLAKALGSWTLNAVAGGAHRSLLDAILAQFSGNLSPSPQLRNAMETVFKNSLAAYGKKHPIQGFVGGLVTLTIDRDDLESAFKAALSGLINDVRKNERHPLRQEFDEVVRQFAAKLQTGDPVMTGSVNALKERVVQNADWTPLIRQTIGWVKGTIQSEATSPNPGLRLLDYDALAKTVSGLLTQLADDIRSNPQHGLRLKLDSMLKEFADKLAAGDPDASEVVERLKRRLLGTADLQGLLQSALAGAKAEMNRQLADPQSTLMQTVERMLVGFVMELRDNPEQREKLDQWLRNACVGFIENNHALIGDVVQNNLRRLDDEQFVTLVRENSWQDLQFIRLNGAIVGFVAGCLLGI